MTMTMTARTRAAWTADELNSDDRTWVVDLDERDATEIGHALKYLKSSRIDPLALTTTHFPLNRLAQKLSVIEDELDTGRGVVLVRGVPTENYSDEDCARIFYGLGLYLGSAMAQNPMGDLLGHVRDEGRDWKADPTARAYQTTSWLPFHTDPGDVVGLLCLRIARTGGLSSIASSIAIHDFLRVERPDLLAALYGHLYYDSRGQEPVGETPWCVLPAFETGERGVTSFFVREYIESAQRFPDVPRLTSLQKEALQLFEELSVDDRFRVDMEFRPGDMQFLNNHVALHSRTGFIDFEEPAKKRHLLRLWLKTPSHKSHPHGYQQFIARLEKWPKRQNVFS